MVNNPRGRFGLPRLTDIGPQVSYHRNKPSRCTTEFCFEDHTKREVLVSIRDAYVENKKDLIDGYKNAGVPVVDIVVSGSVVRGEFGCRDKAKIRDEIRELNSDVYSMSSEFPQEAVEVIMNSIKSESRPQEIFNKAKREMELLELQSGREDFKDIMLDDLIVAICSDIDLFAVLDRGSQSVPAGGLSTRKAVEKTDDIFADMNSQVKGKMIFIISESSVSQEESIGKPTINSAEGFNEILEEYY